MPINDLAAKVPPRPTAIEYSAVRACHDGSRTSQHLIRARFQLHLPLPSPRLGDSEEQHPEAAAVPHRPVQQPTTPGHATLTDRITDQLRRAHCLSHFAVGPVQTGHVAVTAIAPAQDHPSGKRGFDGDQQVVSIDPDFAAGEFFPGHLAGGALFQGFGRTGTTCDRHPLALGQSMPIARQGQGRPEGIPSIQQPLEIASRCLQSRQLARSKQRRILRMGSSVLASVRHAATMMPASRRDNYPKIVAPAPGMTRNIFMPLPLRLAPLFTLLTMLAASATASEWTISTLAGTGTAGFSGDGGPAIAAQLNNPFGVVRGPDGAIWFCEYSGHRVRRIAADGTISTVAGNGTRGFSGDGGPATEAQLSHPHEIRFDAAGNLFIADTGNHAIRRLDRRTGRITTIAGRGGQRGYEGDGGPAAEALLNSPHSLQFGPDGRLYICDVSNHVIRRVEMDTGIIVTFAGTGRPGPTPDGAAVAGTPLNNPRSLDFDQAGNLWLVTREGNQLFKFDLAAGRILHIAGTGEAGFSGNGGPAKLAALSGPKGVAIDRDGNVWMADTESHSIRVVDARTGRLELVAGTGQPGDGPDGDPLRCALNRPHGIFIESDGSVLIGDSEAHRLRVLRRR